MGKREAVASKNFLYLSLISFLYLILNLVFTSKSYCLGRDESGRSLGPVQNVSVKNSLMLANNQKIWLVSMDGRLALTDVSFSGNALHLKANVFQDLSSSLSSRRLSDGRASFTDVNLLSTSVPLSISVPASEVMNGPFGGPPSGQGVLAHDPRFSEGRPIRVGTKEASQSATPGSAHLVFAPSVRIECYRLIHFMTITKNGVPGSLAARALLTVAVEAFDPAGKRWLNPKVVLAGYTGNLDVLHYLNGTVVTPLHFSIEMSGTADGRMLVARGSVVTWNSRPWQIAGWAPPTNIGQLYTLGQTRICRRLDSAGNSALCPPVVAGKIDPFSLPQIFPFALGRFTTAEGQPFSTVGNSFPKCGYLWLQPEGTDLVCRMFTPKSGNSNWPANVNPEAYLLPPEESMESSTGMLYQAMGMNTGYSVVNLDSVINLRRYNPERSTGGPTTWPQGSADPTDRPFSPLFIGSTKGFWNDFKGADSLNVLGLQPRGQSLQFLTQAHALNSVRPSRTINGVGDLVTSPGILSSDSPLLYWEWNTEDCADKHFLSYFHMTELDLPLNLTSVTRTADTSCAFKRTVGGKPAVGELIGGAVLTGDLAPGSVGRRYEEDKLSGFRGQGLVFPSRTARLGLREGICGSHCVSGDRTEFSIEFSILAMHNPALTSFVLAQQPATFVLRMQNQHLILNLRALNAAGANVIGTGDFDLGVLGLTNALGLSRLQRNQLWKHVGVAIKIEAGAVLVSAYVDGNPFKELKIAAPAATHFTGIFSGLGYALVLGPANDLKSPTDADYWMDEFAYSDIYRNGDHFAFGPGNISGSIQKKFLTENEIGSFFSLLHLGNITGFGTVGTNFTPANFPLSDIRIPAELRSFIAGTSTQSIKAARLAKLVNLGQLLFASDALSFGVNGLKQLHKVTGKPMTCVTCHSSALAFTDGIPIATGLKLGDRNTPTLFNRILSRRQFFDQRAENVFTQTLQPILNPAEMNGDLTNIISALKTKTEYSTLKSDFESIFPGVNFGKNEISLALSAFLLTRIKNISLSDQIIAGPASATRSQILFGKFVFENKGRCISCHNGPNFSDELKHDTGISNVADTFKTPSLRNISKTAPYFHDGSMGLPGENIDSVLMKVVNFYSEDFVQKRSVQRTLDPEMRPLSLTLPEKEALVAYLKGL